MSVSLSALLSSFTAGLATFFAPCAFPLLPGYVGYYATTIDGEVPLSGALVRGLAGSAGILIAFGTIAAVVASVGRAAVRHVYALEPFVGVALIAVGASIVLDRVPDIHVALPQRRVSVLGFVIFGAGYAVSATSCFAPLFFAVVLGASTVSIQQTVLSVATFGVGLAIPLAVATVVAGIGFDIGHGAWSGYAERFHRYAGVIIVAVGVWQLLTTAPLL
jgi:cytochrome c-type biogenesis protein